MLDDGLLHAGSSPTVASPAALDGPETVYRHLIMGGWSSQEAGNLVAHLQGLRPAGKGWTVREIEHLLFLRSLVGSGLVES